MRRCLAFVIATACRTPVDTDSAVDSDVEPPACAVDVAFSGAFAGEISGSDALTCSGPTSAGQGIAMQFVPADSALAGFSVDIADITEGGIGSFPASAAVGLTDGRSWLSDACIVEVAGNVSTDEFTIGYQVVGTGSCSAAATSVDEGDVQIGAFEFRFPATWDEG